MSADPAVESANYQYAVAYAASTGIIHALSASTAVREHAYDVLERSKAREQEMNGDPDELFVARRPVPVWTRDPSEEEL